MVQHWGFAPNPTAKSLKMRYNDIFVLFYVLYFFDMYPEILKPDNAPVAIRENIFIFSVRKMHIIKFYGEKMIIIVYNIHLQA